MRKESKLNTKESHQATSTKQKLQTAYGTVSRIDHMLGHKTSLSKFKKIKFILSIFSDLEKEKKTEMNFKNS